MDPSNPYYRQVQLLVQLLPLVAHEEIFALKGGTAINLFVRDFPRLSVDIDLVYLPDDGWDAALKATREALDRLSANIAGTFGARVTRSYLNKPDALRLVVERDGVAVKIELSPVLRGTVYQPERRSVVPAVEEQFGFVEMPVVAFEDLYAGKICAALDRQHPRDLFDVMLLLANEGLTEKLKKALLVYLVSHKRPLEELLAPRFNELRDLYAGEFQGMTLTDVPLADLEATRVRLIETIQAALNADDKAFLCSIYTPEPNGTLLGLDDAMRLPAVRWKLQNVADMPNSRREAALQQLRAVLGV